MNTLARNVNIYSRGDRNIYPTLLLLASRQGNHHFYITINLHSSVSLLTLLPKGDIFLHHLFLNEEI